MFKNILSEYLKDLLQNLLKLYMILPHWLNNIIDKVLCIISMKKNNFKILGMRMTPYYLVSLKVTRGAYIRTYVQLSFVLNPVCSVFSRRTYQRYLCFRDPNLLMKTTLIPGFFLILSYAPSSKQEWVQFFFPFLSTEPSSDVTLECSYLLKNLMLLYLLFFSCGEYLSPL